jgi:hypothetical protein
MLFPLSERYIIQGLMLMKYKISEPLQVKNSTLDSNKLIDHSLNYPLCLFSHWSYTFIFIFYLFIHSYVYTLFGPFLPHAPCPFPLPSPLLLPGRTCSALFSNIVEEKTKAIIRKTKHFF